MTPTESANGDSSVNAVEIENLTKHYGELIAVSDLSLTIAKGEILGLIGPNGAGKTTAIKILVGLALPTSGTARIAGADCVRQSRRIKRLVGYMPDRFGSYDNMRVHEYLDFFGSAFGLRGGVRRRRIEEVLETTSATYMRDRYVESLSHGMQQRVGIARTLLHDPTVLIFDEPANGLDPQARVEMRELLIRLAAMGKTLIVTSHILSELSRICHKVAILSHGQLKAHGTVDQIMRQVSPTRMLEVQLSQAKQIDAAHACISQFDHEAGSINASAAESAIRFRTACHEEQWCQLLKQLLEADIEVIQFREIPTDLENAYLSVTGDDEYSEGEAATEAATISS